MKLKYMMYQIDIPFPLNKYTPNKRFPVIVKRQAYEDKIPNRLLFVSKETLDWHKNHRNISMAQDFKQKRVG